MSQIDDFVLFCERIAAGRYYYYTGSGRCNPLRSGYADCSGLVVAGLHQVGVGIDCTGSFALSIACHHAGTGMSFSEARRTKGALLFKGIHEGQGGRPGIDPGHVAISRGNGTTVEARGRASGIGIFDFDNRGWNYAAWPFWIRRTNPTPPPPVTPPKPPPEQEEAMFDMSVISLVNPAKVGNQQPYAFIDTKARKVWLYWGCRVTWDGGGTSTAYGSHDPHYSMVPGGAPLLGWKQLTWGHDKKLIDTQNGAIAKICAYGINGAQYYGTLHY